jgi:phytoene dehydrogenase-like protein
MSNYQISRRCFLANLAIAGVTPIVCGRDPLAWFQPPRQFTGEDVEGAHRLLMNPQEVLASATIERHPGVFDAIVVGGGISGLATAWWLRDRNITLLERASEIGGVSRSETWNGIEYALGAAYIIDPDPESEDEREKRGFELLRDLDLRAAGEDLSTDRSKERRLSGDGNHCIFTRRRVLRETDVYSARNTAFFEHVLDSDDYPGIPAENEALVKNLDLITFERFLASPALQRKIYGRSVGPLSPFAREAVEYYFWGAFGTSASETSAYHGLNFFAAEYGDILVYPGGNARIAKRLGERIEQQKPGRIRTGVCVLRIEPGTDGRTWAVLAHERGRVLRYEARSVVFSSPLFLAPRIIPGLPDTQKGAIASLSYRSYVVANVLLARPIDRLFAAAGLRNGYELTPVHGREIRRGGAEALSRQNVFSDAVVADFPVGRHAAKSVLTVYRPYPYDGGKAEVLSRTYAEQEDEVRRAVMEQFGAHGLRAADVEDIRLSRWGHAMIVAKPGQLAEGIMRRASAPGDGLFFAHTDTQGAPAYENALAAAMDAADAVVKRV